MLHSFGVVNSCLLEVNYSYSRVITGGDKFFSSSQLVIMRSRVHGNVLGWFSYLWIWWTQVHEPKGMQHYTQQEVTEWVSDSNDLCLWGYTFYDLCCVVLYISRYPMCCWHCKPVLGAPRPVSMPPAQSVELSATSTPPSCSPQPVLWTQTTTKCFLITGEAAFTLCT